MIRLRAPAKLNLYLRVLGTRPDGYHEIETVFERIDLADELTFEPHPSALSLTCTDPGLSCGGDNLVMRAARLLQEVTGPTRGARIHVIKRIPLAAGLGGGSSDAAATLLGLNQLWRLGLGHASLLRLASAVGSDVPFFLTDGPFAIGRGRGDACEPVASGTRLAHLLVVPPERLSTAAVYAASGFDLTASKPSLTMGLHALSNGSLGELAEGLWNDLEPEAIRRCPVISRIQSHLRESGAVAARVCGSGSAVFGLCRDLPHAQAVASRLHARAPSDWRVEVVQTDRESSLVTRADSASTIRG